MATKKYELTTETKVVFGRTLHRIKALVSFGDVAAGELGGWIEKEANLDHDGDAWVYGDARVCGNAWVYGDARVYGHAEVYGDARVTSCKAYLLFGPAGSRSDFTTFFARRDAKIGVACGCFRGDIDEFAAAVAKRHKDNEHGKVYALAIEMAKQHIVLPEVME
jgi:hypothetical protein